MASDKKVDTFLFYAIVYPAARIDKAGIASIGAAHDWNAVLDSTEDTAGSVLVCSAATAIPCVICNNDEKLRTFLDKFFGYLWKYVFEADKSCKFS